jgi:uncharacterized protein YdcH (DUF465 family)
MSPILKEKYLILLKDPYFWMVRGVIGLAGILYTPWAFVVLPIGEILGLTWFDELFKGRLERQKLEASKREREELLKLLADKDRGWYQRVTLYIEQVKKYLPHSEYHQQVNFDELSLDFIKRLILLRKAETAERHMVEEVITGEIAKLEEALKRETNARVRATLSERLALQKQRLELKNKISSKLREMEAQLKLIEDQILHLRDLAISSGIQDSASQEIVSTILGSGLSDKITDLSQQLRISSEIAEEMQTMLDSPSQQPLMEQ